MSQSSRDRPLKKNASDSSQPKKENSMTRALQKEWMRDVRSLLVVVEEKNIELRCKRFNKIINEATTELNSRLFSKKQVANLCRTRPSDEFRVAVSETLRRESLQYIYNWSGLSHSSVMPNTKKKYILKARNWLNGRRTKEYGNTLYVNMLQQAIEHAHSLCTHIQQLDWLPDLEAYTEYKTAMVRLYLVRLLPASMRLSQSVKCSKLLSEYTLLGKTKLRQLIQEYAEEKCHKDSTFPCHRRQAVDYFTTRYQEQLRALKTKLHGETASCTPQTRTMCVQRRADTDGDIDIEVEETCKQQKEDGHCRWQSEEKRNNARCAEPAAECLRIIEQTLRSKDEDGKVSIAESDLCVLMSYALQLHDDYTQSEQEIERLQEKVSSLENTLCLILLYNLANQIM